jgi:hypothetical protein
MEEPDLAGNNAAPMARPRRPRCGCRRGWPWGHAVLARQEGLVMGFVAYDCTNATNRMEPAACPTTEDHHEMERIIFGEIAQMKSDRTVPVFRCTVIESVISFTM